MSALYRLLRCRHLAVIQGRKWRCERWLHFGEEHR